ncbi:hypothetical protein [Streptomyces sp. CBMA29]|uniref:hypothetical protein n=1 Tax=Streptomyces sp. CBMA29 TaxID=1896314 RepID=UPI001CB73AF7|nr:hypothetical protein [Streptomyces sp. CBMA29]
MTDKRRNAVLRFLSRVAKPREGSGSVGDELTESNALLSLVSEAVRCEPGERIVTTSVVCPLCDTDTFEVAGNECFCEGCCVPAGLEDGELHSCELPFVLAGSVARPDPVCPEGHDVFQVALAYGLGEDHEVRRLSVGLRCPIDGALDLLLNNAPVVPRRIS